DWTFVLRSATPLLTWRPRAMGPKRRAQRHKNSSVGLPAGLRRIRPRDRAGAVAAGTLLVEPDQRGAPCRRPPPPPSDTCAARPVTLAARALLPGGPVAGRGGPAAEVDRRLGPRPAPARAPAPPGRARAPRAGLLGRGRRRPVAAPANG